MGDQSSGIDVPYALVLSYIWKSGLDIVIPKIGGYLIPLFLVQFPHHLLKLTSFFVC